MEEKKEEEEEEVEDAEDEEDEEEDVEEEEVEEEQGEEGERCNVGRVLFNNPRALVISRRVSRLRREPLHSTRSGPHPAPTSPRFFPSSRGLHSSTLLTLSRFLSQNIPSAYPMPRLTSEVPRTQPLHAPP